MNAREYRHHRQVTRLLTLNRIAGLLAVCLIAGAAGGSVEYFLRQLLTPVLSHLQVH